MNDDRPIRGRVEDRLGRAGFAEALALEIATAPGDAGLVLALLGPWGTGKTSVLNMVAEVLEDRPDVAVLRFNPWYFTGTEQLVSRFFAEVVAQLAGRKEKLLKGLAERLEGYSRRLEPIGSVPVLRDVAQTVAGGAAVAGAAARRGQRYGRGSIEQQRSAIDATLSASPKRLVVVVDDIDRLEPSEVRDIVRLVRLVADFPRTTYLLAFDRGRIERVLGDGDDSVGRDYLEKIVQGVHNLPRLRQADLDRLLTGSLDEAIEGHSTGPFDIGYWQNVFAFVVRPLVKTPRDVRRYVNAIPAALIRLEDEVNLVDVLALEAIRVLQPEVFELLADSSETLTYSHLGYIGGGDDRAQRDAHAAVVERLISAGGEQAAAIRELCRWVFPGSRAFFENTHYGPEWRRTWRRERRVAHPDVLRIYLEAALPAGALPAAAVRAAFAHLTDGAGLKSLLDLLSPDQLEELLGRLEDFEDEFPEDVSDAVAVLMSQSDRLREGRSGMWDLGADLALTRVVLRLLRRVADEPVRETIAARAFDQMPSLSSRIQLLLIVGYEPNAGHKLVSESEASRLGQELRDLVLRSSPDDLARERELPQLLSWALRDDEPGALGPVRQLLDDDAVLFRLLRSTLSEAFSQTIGQVDQHREHQLPWDWLGKLIGQDRLDERVRAVVSAIDDARLDERGRAAVETARRYLAGWRPSQWGDGDAAPADDQPIESTETGVKADEA
jgi:predicted KAP-like P-loop ATPase